MLPTPHTTQPPNCDNSGHPLALFARLELAAWLGDAGQFEHARAASAAATTDCISALGPDHELTLTGRHQTALWTLVAGHTESATRQFHDLLRDTRHALGDDHPLTQDSRKHIEDPQWNDGYYLPDTW